MSGIYTGDGIYNDVKKNGVGWGSVSIGGEDYEYIQVLDKLITVRNLDYLPDGVTIGDGTTTAPKACYFNNNETQAKERQQGLMYNWSAAKYIIDNNLLPAGWSLFTIDIATLLSYCFNASYNTGEGKESCRQHTSWASYNWNHYGNNKSHLSIIPCGRRQNGNWEGYGDFCRIWTNQAYKTFNIAIEPYSKWPGIDTVDDSGYCYIRLFKEMQEPE